MRLPILALLTGLTLAPALAAQTADKTFPSMPPAPWPPVATFSILGYDPATGEVGGAVQSRVFSVGNGVLWAEAGVGVAATQAIVDVSYGPQAIALLRGGMKPADVIKQVWERDPDPRPQDWTKYGRQFAVIDAQGNVAVLHRAGQHPGRSRCGERDGQGVRGHTRAPLAPPAGGPRSGASGRG